jgi:hypothetical protein
VCVVTAIATARSVAGAGGWTRSSSGCPRECCTRAATSKNTSPNARSAAGCGPWPLAARTGNRCAKRATRRARPNASDAAATPRSPTVAKPVRCAAAATAQTFGPGAAVVAVGGFEPLLLPPRPPVLTCVTAAATVRSRAAAPADKTAPAEKIHPARPRARAVVQRHGDHAPDVAEKPRSPRSGRVARYAKTATAAAASIPRRAAGADAPRYSSATTRSAARSADRAPTSTATSGAAPAPARPAPTRTGVAHGA